ncbi:MAG: hypothetical protein A2W98_02265 [Bacteroidetes bacterium GWF2_33_38]|nr:MAG: hypothetical protein A2W98_02265 [Bacteroidetes bacterium GWF2_33_38]OFY87660.1 MAG: hypothetical protein A2236_13215 [Bacteroidetes bacterium RIFOXYA2_FULL_33_7]HBX51642.1 hypothetical protein [Bacteroidales bacterium]
MVVVFIFCCLIFLLSLLNFDKVPKLCQSSNSYILVFNFYFFQFSENSKTFGKLFLYFIFLYFN